MKDINYKYHSHTDTMIRKKPVGGYMKKERININGDYLLIAPKKDIGNYQALVERDFLADNIIAFLKNHPDVDVHQITIYELREINSEV